ncbi:hypothetical protein [Haladaptatus sp. NG-WS-4]
MPSGEFDDLAAVLTHVCARHRVNIFIVSGIVFIQVERNQCVRNDVVVACFKRDACCSGVKRDLGPFTELFPRVGDVLLSRWLLQTQSFEERRSVPEAICDLALGEVVDR